MFKRTMIYLTTSRDFFPSLSPQPANFYLADRTPSPLDQGLARRPGVMHRWLTLNVTTR